MANSAFSPSVLTLPSTGGTGQGELNLVANPVGAADNTGWVGATRQSGGGPLNPTVSTYFTVSAANSAESSTSGARYSITLPSGLQNRKLKVEFYYTSSTDVYYVSVYKGTTRVALSTDSASVTALPTSTTGKFTAYFDTDSSGSWSVNVTRTTGNGTALSFTQVVVGPGIQPQGAVVGEWQSYTPTLTNNGSKGFTISAFWRRVGSSAEIQVDLFGNATASGSTATSALTVSLPTGLTADLSKVTAGNSILGSAYTYNVLAVGQIDRQMAPAISTGGTSFVFTKPTTNINYSTADLNTTANTQFFARLMVPIAEWAGSGTVQLAQNDVEFAASTSGTWDAPASAAQTVYGPAGATITGALTVTRTKVVQFNSPIQPGDKLTLEYQYASGGPWTDATLTNVPFTNMATVAFGGYINTYPATNQAQVSFQQYAVSGSVFNTTTGATPWGTAGTPVAWRVRKSSAGAAVGFGIVSGSSAGLLPASNSNLDDATATRLGLKQYLHGGSYKDGLAPTVTSGQAGFTVARAVFIPYQMQDGTWRVKFNISASFTSASLTTYSLTINGITTVNTIQSVTAATDAGTGISPKNAFIAASGNVLAVYFSTFTDSFARISGDIELSSKPTWAYS